tara:strand:- start:730 stop:1539 length:810 start_codon:yes stop_codon:yes gene_type:complete
MKLPYIFIFDIDQCIVGDVRHLLNETVIFRDLQEHYGKITNYKSNFDQDMKNGLLRPGFIDFIHCIKKRFAPCELFLYTNSSYNWTNTMLVPTIEKATKIKFNKPYFTRESSILLKKSLDEVYEKIFPILQKKYKIPLKHKDFIINNNLLFIDNIKDNTSTHTNRQITCPEYDHCPYRCPYENMLSVFGTDIIWTENVEKKIFNKTNIEYYNPYSDKILIKDKIIYNTNKLLKIRDAELLNEKYKDDNFYLTLCDKLTDLTDKTIANIK